MVDNDTKQVSLSEMQKTLLLRCQKLCTDWGQQISVILYRELFIVSIAAIGFLINHTSKMAVKNGILIGSIGCFYATIFFILVSAYWTGYSLKKFLRISSEILVRETIIQADKEKLHKISNDTFFSYTFQILMYFLFFIGGSLAFVGILIK